MKTFLAALVVLAASTASGFSDAHYKGETEMVTKADAIAVIEVSKVESSEQKGTHWTYRQAANAKVVQRIKGDLPETFTLYGKEDFICAQCILGTGRYLAFLKRDGDLWAGANWHLSLRPVKDGQTEWFETDPISPLAFKPSEVVLSRVREIIGNSRKP